VDCGEASPLWFLVVPRRRKTKAVIPHRTPNPPASLRLLPTRCFRRPGCACPSAARPFA
jgi:hypothetical protein